MVAIVIPARMASSRFPGKPLAILRGANGRGKTLVHRCAEAALSVPGAARVIVATDDALVAAEAKRAGVQAIMTSPLCRNGTERVAEAAVAAGLRDDVVVNLQGDAPLTPPAFVAAIADALAADARIAVATPVLRCDETSLRHFREDRAAGRVGATTAVFTRDGDALYFSKEIIPFTDGRAFPAEEIPVFHHVGLYAYRLDALAAYAASPPTPLEQIEGLEQLRFLETGTPIRVIAVAAHGRSFWEVNNPEDIPRVEAQLAALGID